MGEDVLPQYSSTQEQTSKSAEGLQYSNGDCEVQAAQAAIQSPGPEAFREIGAGMAPHQLHPQPL